MGKCCLKFLGCLQIPTFGIATIGQTGATGATGDTGAPGTNGTNGLNGSTILNTNISPASTSATGVFQNLKSYTLSPNFNTTNQCIVVNSQGLIIPTLNAFGSVRFRWATDFSWVSPIVPSNCYIDFKIEVYKRSTSAVWYIVTFVATDITTNSTIFNFKIFDSSGLADATIPQIIYMDAQSETVIADVDQIGVLSFIVEQKLPA